jgi:hypothetical protein
MDEKMLVKMAVVLSVLGALMGLCGRSRQTLPRQKFAVTGHWVYPQFDLRTCSGPLLPACIEAQKHPTWVENNNDQ